MFCSAIEQKYGEDEDPQSESISMVGEKGTKHLGESFFSTYSKCDILLENSCEAFNKYILVTPGFKDKTRYTLYVK
jgi:hypothetical protein